jgi:hypothetical protein
MARSRVAIVVLVLALGRGRAFASEPLSLGGLRLTLGGEASQSFAARDRGYFNYTGYTTNPLRLTRLRLTAELRAGEHVAALSEVRSEDLGTPRVYALYLRLRPWTERGFDVQAGLVPPVFGSFLRRSYGPGNLLIGEPLAYQYLTTLRADAMPLTPDELLEQRGEGWLAHYGEAPPTPGLSLVSGVRWDAGVQARWRSERVEMAAALTQGTLSRPRVREDNGGKQLSGRLAWRPLTGLALGVSGARGDYVSDTSPWTAGMASTCCHQQAWGADAEYSAGHGLLRAEAVWSSWEVPAWSPPLRARALSIEGSYRIVPGLYAAARAGRLGFSQLTGSTGTMSWDAPVTRVETGLGYSLRRNLVLKAVWQRNRRDGGTVRHRSFVAGQVMWWF